MSAFHRRWPVVLAGALFLLGTGAGFFSNLPRPELDALNLATAWEEPPPLLLLLIINGFVVLQLALGFFTAGALSIGWTCLQGFHLGSAVGAVLRDGAAVSQMIAALAPHGVIEIPAVILAGAAGLGGAGALAAEASGRRDDARGYARQALIRLFIALGMVVLAALLERWITPMALRAVL